MNLPTDTSNALLQALLGLALHHLAKSDTLWRAFEQDVTSDPVMDAVMFQEGMAMGLPECPRPANN